jgi:CheY-like chemotaxis protein
MGYKSNLRLLIVDDNIAFIKLFTRVLEIALEDFKIEAIDYALNGQECIDKVHENWYNVIFMDVDMPVMNGIEATAFITAQLRDCIVLAVSYNNELENIQKMLEAGARNYLVKEKITPEIIRGVLDNIFSI